MRLKDADRLKAHYAWWGNEEKELFDSIVDQQPTVDAVPVVRCKDCRWHEQEQPGMVYCPAVVGGWVEENWFCAGGERKDGADDAVD